MSTAATQPSTDFDTDISACGRSAAPSGPYHSATSSPSCSTTYASVKVSSKTSPTEPTEPTELTEPAVAADPPMRTTGRPDRSTAVAAGGRARAGPAPRATW